MFFKKICKKVAITLTVFELLLSECRLALSTAQRSTGNERVKFSVKNQKKYSDFAEIAWKVIDLQA